MRDFKPEKERKFTFFFNEDNLVTQAYLLLERRKRLNPILYNYHIGSYTKDKSSYTVLCILHELRIVTRGQLLKLINFDFSLKENGLDKTIKILYDKNLIDKYKFRKTTAYFLTKEGHHSIGGYYTIPKVPEYNLAHHLEINDYLITVIDFVKDMPQLKYIQTERRKVYEIKDFKANSKNVKYFVPDFICRFVSINDEEIDWSFEIELTLKSRNRYLKGIFPKYIKQLEDYEEEHLFYVTPSPIIESELELFKTNFPNDELAFERLHIISANNFEKEFEESLTGDPYINW